MIVDYSCVIYDNLSGCTRDIAYYLDSGYIIKRIIFIFKWRDLVILIIHLLSLYLLQLRHSISSQALSTSLSRVSLPPKSIAYTPPTLAFLTNHNPHSSLIKPKPHHHLQHPHSGICQVQRPRQRTQRVLQNAGTKPDLLNFVIAAF